VFALTYFADDEEVHDTIEEFRSDFDTVAGTIRAVLPGWAFTNKRRGDGSYEAIVFLGFAPRRDPDGDKSRCPADGG